MEPDEPAVATPSPPVLSSPAPPREPATSPWRRRLEVAAEVALVIGLVGALGLWCSIPDTARLAEQNPSSTAFIDLRRADAEAAGKPFTLRWQWRSLGAISRYLRAAVIYAEDYNFYRHDGVDWDAIEHAVSADWNKGAMAVGGSTITQQLAKNLYLSPRRSVIRKLREAMIAFSLEDHLSKQRILELYLNVVEWGDGVFGAEAAARTWFHHPAQSLTPAEAIRLAIALPNPLTRAPNVRDPELTRKAVRLVRLLRMQGLLDAGQERTALDELGASGERVLPDRDIPTPVPEPGSTRDAPALPSSSAAPRAASEPVEPSAPPPEPAAGEPVTRPEPSAEPPVQGAAPSPPAEPSTVPEARP